MSDEKVALITAGASGIGRAVAEMFLSNGLRVHVCDVDKAALSNFLGVNPGATGSLTDVGDAAAVTSMFAEFSASYDRLDILVNNAGISGPTAAVEDIEVDEWDRTMAVDLNSVFYVTRMAVPVLKRSAQLSGSSAIVNMASNAGLFGCPLRSAYTAAKWGIIGLTKTWAIELGPHRIRVNALCPGSVEGERINKVIASDARTRGESEHQIQQTYRQQNSMGVFIESRDIASMANFLCSDAGKHISGQAIAIDGHTERLT